MNDERRELRLRSMFAAAVVLRVAIVLATTLAFRIPLENYTNKGDGESYKRYALAILREPTELTNYDTRVLPGFPLLIAGLHLLGLPVGIAGLLIDAISAGAAAVFAAMLFNDRRVGWAMVMLIPHYVINSSLVMSEAPMLAFSLAALLGGVRRPLVGGLLLGFAMLIRPVAGFAALGYALCAVRQREWKPLALFAASATCIVIVAMIGLHLRFGSALHWAHTYANDPGAYNGQLFLPPFGSLILTLLRSPAASRRAPYIAAHVLLTLLCCGLIVREYKRNRSTQTLLASPWLLANTAFVLCIGSHWGFDHFPRFTIPAQPAMFYAMRRWLPRASWAWTIALIAMFVFGVFGVRASP